MFDSLGLLAIFSQDRRLEHWLQDFQKQLYEVTLKDSPELCWLARNGGDKHLTCLNKN